MFPEFLSRTGTPSDSQDDLCDCAVIPPVELIYVEFYLPPSLRHQRGHHHNTLHARTLSEETHSSSPRDGLQFHQ